MVNVEFDGIYCPKCNGLHPTLYWHEKYDDYLLKSHVYEAHRKTCSRFGIVFTDDECQKEYLFQLSCKKISYKKESGVCAICGCQTNFISSEKKMYVCSDECRHALYVSTIYCDEVNCHET